MSPISEAIVYARIGPIPGTVRRSGMEGWSAPSLPLDDGLGWTARSGGRPTGSRTSGRFVATASGATRGHPLDRTRGAGDVPPVRRADRPSHRRVVHERIY